MKIKINKKVNEGDVIRGSFGGQPAADLGKPATVSPIRKAGPAMPEGTEWLTDASALIDAVMNNIDDIAKVDEALANKLFDLADKLSPIFKSGSESLADLPAGAFADDPDRRENASTERTYEDPEDL